jgi:2-phospho-L-lactate transferase/gluconeogenesis factor (CofD/UPF0052 family)
VPDDGGACVSGVASTARVVIAFRDEPMVSALLSPANPVTSVIPMLPATIVSVRQAMARVGRMDRTVRQGC